jgi:hypothetical protein
MSQESAAVDQDAEYILPEPQKEVKRLTENDTVFSYAMGGRKVFAPLDLAQPGLKILDSGTADGLFLRAITPALTAPYTLEGYDIMPSFFPAQPPPNTKLAVHSLAEEWPTEMHGQYDLVHQRLSLLGVGRTTTPRNAIGFLAALVKPGGWLQIGELDVREPDDSLGGQAMKDAMTVIRAVFRAVCGEDDFAQRMADYLRDAGLENVREEKFQVDLGPRCKDAAMGQKGIELLQESWTALLGAAQHFGADLPESTTNRLVERLGEELGRDGGSYVMMYAYGRKPKAA